MAHGVDIPLRITARGGLATTRDGLEAIIAAKLLPSGSSNPWHVVLGVGSPDYGFAVADARTRASVRRRVADAFANLERDRRAQLVDVTVRSGSDGRLLAVIRYRRLGRSGAPTEEMELTL